MYPETLDHDAILLIFGSKMGPKWLQNGSKMAPWRLPGGPGALPGGFREALGRRGRFLSDFWVYFGHRFGSKNR